MIYLIFRVFLNKILIFLIIIIKLKLIFYLFSLNQNSKLRLVIFILFHYSDMIIIIFIRLSIANYYVTASNLASLSGNHILNIDDTSFSLVQHQTGPSTHKIRID